MVIYVSKIKESICTFTNESFIAKLFGKMEQMERFRTKNGHWRPIQNTLELPTSDMQQKIIDSELHPSKHCYTAMDEWQRLLPKCLRTHAQGLDIF